MRPNVLVIVLDTARADGIESYGAPAGTTPALAQLASRGRAHPSVHSTACWTMPSHASMFTGLLPRAAGLGRAPGGVPHGCRPVVEQLEDRFLPAVLRKAGYRTRGVSTNIWVANASGFGTGFDDFRDVKPTRESDMAGRDLGPRLRWGWDAFRAKSDDGATEAGGILREWFAEAGEGPDFWFVNLIECHSPYLPPKPWNDLGPLDRLRAAEEARRHLTLGEIWRICLTDSEVPTDALERMRHLYDRAIRQLDAWVADMLTALDEAKRLDDTLVVVVSDHGENFGEGGLMGHAFSLDERLTHVPFIAAGPGAPAKIRSLVEIPRMIADASGIESHPWDGDPVPAAVAQYDPPGDPDDPRKHEVLDAWGAGPDAHALLATPAEAAYGDGVKLVRRGESLELIDLAEDPLEERPRSVERADAPPVLLAAIEGQGAAPVAAAAPAAPPEASAEELARIEEQMRTLGYL